MNGQIIVTGSDDLLEELFPLAVPSPVCPQSASRIAASTQSTGLASAHVSRDTHRTIKPMGSSPTSSRLSTSSDSISITATAFSPVTATYPYAPSGRNETLTPFSIH